MKKIVFMLLLAAAGKELPAQQPFPFHQSLASEMIFDRPEPGTPRSRFFFSLPAGNMMIIETNDICGMNNIPDLDSVFQKIWKDLEPMKDSLTDPLIIRRVDYVSSSANVKIRIKQHKPADSYFSYKDDELVQMKVDQDTIMFRGLFATGKIITINGTESPAYASYSVILVLNNISNIDRLPSGLLNACVDLMLKDFTPLINHARKKGFDFNKHFAYYDMLQKKRISPVNFEHSSWKKDEFIPYVQLGIQYGRGSWMSSVGAGFQYSHYNRVSSEENIFMLMWEPLFFFERNADKKLVTTRNDFITFKYRNISQSSPSPKKLTVEEYLNFSIGYLIRRKGDWFESTTFKFSVPGLQTKNILLEPEFFFNKFFQNFSPSLKLTMYIE